MEIVIIINELPVSHIIFKLFVIKYEENSLQLFVFEKLFMQPVYDKMKKIKEHNVNIRNKQERGGCPKTGTYFKFLTLVYLLVIAVSKMILSSYLVRIR